MDEIIEKSEPVFYRQIKAIHKDCGGELIFIDKKEYYTKHTIYNYQCNRCAKKFESNIYYPKVEKLP